MMLKIKVSLASILLKSIYSSNKYDVRGRDNYLDTLKYQNLELSEQPKQLNQLSYQRAYFHQGGGVLPTGIHST